MNTTANQTEISEATRARAVRAAQGLEPFDLLLTGAEIVDVITGEVRAADVGLVGNMIASVHERDACSNALATHNLSGKTLAPGFIDSHVHIESSHLLPEHYAAAVIPQGTTTIYYDPHELANVLGIEGVRYAIEATRRLPLRCLCQASSSVPSAPGLEVAGASIGANEMRTMLSWPEVVGVAEMMDMKGVLNASDRMATIAAEARLAGKVMEGHARSLAGAPLQAYLAAGVATDHELTSGADFIEKLRAGLTIQIRGSHDYVLPQIVEELNKLPHVSSQITVCTDDVPPDQLLANGGVADLLRRFIAYGARPADAYRFATLNAALHLNRRDLGAIAAGRIADLVVLTNLEQVAIESVYASGKLAACNGKLTQVIAASTTTHPLNTVKLKPLALDAFRIAVKNVQSGQAEVRTIRNIRFTEWGTARVAVRHGFVDLDDTADLNYLFAIHRHGVAQALPQMAIQQGLKRMSGAIATTYEHDSHNLFVAGGNSEDMQLAANALIESGGGMAVAQAGNLLAIVEMPVAGMLSLDAPEQVARKFREVREAAGLVTEWLPPYWRFKAIEGMSLICNPYPHLTDQGLIDGKTGERFEVVLSAIANA